MGLPGRGWGRAYRSELSRGSSCLLFVSLVPVRSGFEEGGAGPRKEHARSDSENWRSLRDEQEDDGSWRLGAGPRRDGDRWRSTSPGEMGERWGSGILVTLGKEVARHMRNEKIAGEAMLVGKAW